MRNIVLVFVVLLFLQTALFAAEPRPNILFIVLDDLGWMDLNCQGNKNLNTPRIDALAKRGFVLPVHIQLLPFVHLLVGR